MPYTQESALLKATKTQTTVALSKLRLFKSSFVPNPANVKADFVAAEADYDGYAAGGIAITAFLAPFINPAGGATTISPVTLFSYTPGDDLVTNLIGGWWLELAAGGLWVYDSYPQPVGMARLGDAIPQIVQLTEGRNAV